MPDEHFYMRIGYDTSEYDHLLDDLADEPGSDTILALESVLSAAFAATQAQVHVITGRLRASGRVESSVHNNVWFGDITYGGPETGVEYAWYEQRRNGSHDYMRAAEELDVDFEEAVVRTIGE